jgi:hypothetical protein
LDIDSEITVNSSSDQPPFAPFHNKSTALLMGWYYNGTNQKSAAEVQHLADEVLKCSDFNASELKDFSISQENKCLDTGFDCKMNNAEHAIPPAVIGQWEEHSVFIRLLTDKGKFSSEEATPEFEVPGVIMHPLLSVMKEAFEGREFHCMHLTPFLQYWDPDHDPESNECNITESEESSLNHEPIYSEIYTSQAMFDAHQALPSDPHLETVIAAFLVWSDLTQLAQFGTASLWPIYTFFGNVSKYFQAQPSSGTAHHQAYIPSVSISSSFIFLSISLLS